MRRLLVILTVFFLLSNAPVSSEVTPPVIDGDITDPVWSTADSYQVPMQNQITVDFRIFVDKVNMYFLAIIPHDGPNDVISLDTTQPHDYFGLEFDNNGDNVIHGTESSPDDMVLVNYFQEGAQDFLTQRFQVINDTEFGGREDSVGVASTDGSNLIFEFSKPLDSGDSLGADVSLSPNDSISIMLAFWDDRPVHDANVFVNKPVDGSVFLKFQLRGDPLENVFMGGISMIGMLVSFLLVHRKFYA